MNNNSSIPPSNNCTDDETTEIMPMEKIHLELAKCTENDNVRDTIPDA